MFLSNIPPVLAASFYPYHFRVAAASEQKGEVFVKLSRCEPPQLMSHFCRRPVMRCAVELSSPHISSRIILFHQERDI